MTQTAEKAREIIIKMQFQKEPLMFEQAKRCAIVCVQEMLEYSKENDGIRDVNGDPYWQEVLKEIDLA